MLADLVTAKLTLKRCLHDYKNHVAANFPVTAELVNNFIFSKAVAETCSTAVPELSQNGAVQQSKNGFRTVQYSSPRTVSEQCSTAVQERFQNSAVQQS